MKSLIERDATRVWHPYTQAGFGLAPLPVVSAQGSSLTLEDGRTVLDGISSWWCCLHGHGDARLVKAAADQFKKLDHVLFAGVTHEPAVQLAEKLCEIVPHNFSKVFFSDNGSTAVEVAIKLAVQLWRNRGERRTKIVALEGGYHGDTFGAMAVGARSIFSRAFEELLFSVEYLSIDGTESDFARCEELCKAGDVACFIFEPLVQGAGGMRMYDPKVLDRYCRTFKAHGTLCIADEVMTGFGRTGPLFASQKLTVPPDLICLSKGITSGTLPLAVTLCRDEVYNEFISSDHSRTFFHGHTYTANPIACAVALASLDIVTSEECRSAQQLISDQHARFLPVLEQYPIVQAPRSMGPILAFDIHSEGVEGYRNRLAQRAYQFFTGRGVLLRPLGSVVYFMPPYCFTKEELHTVYGTLVEFIESESKNVSGSAT